jgi:hypothetical protein
MKPKCCPICASTEIKLYSDVGDGDEDEPFWSEGDQCGVVLDEEKTGCFDWQFVVVGYTCSAGHVFFVGKKES